MSELLVEKQQGVPEGYKLTEVGVIPEDWSIAILDNHVEKVGSGKTPTGGSSVYVDSGRPFIRSQNVGKGYLDLSDVVYISEETHKTFTGSEIKENDVLLNITGASIGRCSKSISLISGGNVNQHVCIIRTFKNSLLPSLLVELINSELGQNQIDSYQAGGNREGLNFKQVRQLTFPVAKNIKEQTAIATTLSDVDELLVSLEALIAKKQAIKTATMQQLLSGRTRLPQFALREDGSPKGYKPSELGEIPEDWEVKSYEEIFTYLSTSTNSRADLSSIGDYGYVHYGDIHTKWNNKLDLNQVELPQVSKELVSSAFIEDGDVIMADASEDYEGVGKSVEVSNIGDRKAVAGLHTFLLRDREKKLSDGFRGYLHTIPIVKASLDKMATGLKVYGISKRNLALILIPIPSKQEQTAIATILSDMDAELEALEKQLNKTQQIKQGMMQQLLTGKIRLVNPN